MNRRTLADWQRLIEKQQESGLSIAAFCKEHKLPTSNFYKYRTRLQENEQIPKLIKVDSKATQPLQSSFTLTLTHGNTQLTFSSQCEPHWLASFMKELNR